MYVDEVLGEVISENTTQVLLEEIHFKFREEVDLALKTARGSDLGEVGFLHFISWAIGYIL